MKNSCFALLGLLLIAAPALAQAPTPETVRRSNELVEEAGALMSEMQTEKALGLLSQAVQMNPRNPTIPYLMAVCEFNLSIASDDPDRILRARQHLDAAIELDPRWGEPFFFLGVLSFQRHDYRTAIFGFENSLQRGYRVKDSHSNRAQTLFLWGVALANDPQQVLDPVIDVFAKAVDAFEFLKDDLRFPLEERKRFHRFWIDSMINLASVHLLAQNKPEAEGLIRRLIALEPTRYLHHYNLGLSLGRSEGGWKDALVEYQKALDLNPDEDWIEPYPRIGFIHSQLASRENDPEVRAKNAAEAESWFLRYLEKHPQAVDPMLRLGEHYQLFDQPDKAIAIYRRAIEADPLKINLMQKLGMALSSVGRTEEGERWIQLHTELERIDREGTKYRDGTRPGQPVPLGPGADRKRK